MKAAVGSAKATVLAMTQVREESTVPITGAREANPGEVPRLRANGPFLR